MNSGLARGSVGPFSDRQRIKVSPSILLSRRRQARPLKWVRLVQFPDGRGFSETQRRLRCLMRGQISEKQLVAEIETVRLTSRKCNSTLPASSCLFFVWAELESHRKTVLKAVFLSVFRTRHATLLDAVGAPLGTVQALLGHASPEVTRQIYLHAIPEEQRRAVEKVEKLLIGPKWTQVSEVAQKPN